MTETTDKTSETVRYDATCAVCTRWARRAAPRFARHGVRFVPLTEPGPEMVVERRDGTRDGGADAVVYLAGKLGWGRPLVWLSRLPGAMPVLRAGYRWVARNRYCFGGRCEVVPMPHPLEPSVRNVAAGVSLRPGRGARNVRTQAKACGDRRSMGFLVLSCLVGGALLTRSLLPAWAFMWVMVGALFVGFKWLMWRRGEAWPVVAGGGAPGGRARPVPGNMALGATLIWGVVRFVPVAYVAGWVGMIGFVLLLHFGLLPALMNAPARSRSVGEFWRRWNTAFPRLVRPLIFEPVRCRCGARAATLVVFLFSGLVHELVISVPAGAGYGLPTLYFLLQGLAAGERTPRPRWWTWLVVAGPVGILFHPPFVARVVVPMLRAWGAW